MIKALEGLNWVFILSLVVAVETQIGNGTMSLANMFPDSWIPFIKAWSANLGSVGALIVAGGSYGKSYPSAATQTVAKAVIAAVALSLFVLTASPVLADPVADAKAKINAFNHKLIPGSTSSGPTLTGNADKDLQSLWNKIVSASNTDLTYAAALATSANTASSKIRLQCWQAIITLNQQANGATLKNADGTPMVKPDPHLFSDAESLAEVIDNLSPQGPLFTACAGAAQLAKTNTLTLINAVVTGAAGMAALPVGIIP